MMILKRSAPLWACVAALSLASCLSTPPAPTAPAPTGPSSARIRAEELVRGEMGGSSLPAPGSAPGTSSGTGTAIAETTNTQTITNTADPQGTAAGTPATPAAEPITTTSASAATVNELTADEKAFFENYLRRLRYMVVFKEGASVSDFQLRSVIAKANEFLLRQGYDVIQYDQYLKVLADQQAAYAAEAGANVSLVQFIAQKLGADIYVEIDARAEGSTEASRHYGKAQFTVSMFDPSTAEAVGSVSYASDRSVSFSSVDDAMLNALVASTAQFMPRVVRDSSSVLRNRYTNGISYQIVLQKTSDARMVALFRRHLMSRVREVRLGPSSADETRLDVYLFGTIANLEDACYAAFDKTPGMEGAYMVYTRGKSITFNTGN